MSLKKFFRRIGNFFKNIFEGLPKAAQKAVSIAVEITERLKNYDLNNPGAADLLTMLIPGDADAKLVAKLREAIPKISMELRFIQAAQGLTDPNEIMAKVVEFVQMLEGDYRSAFLHDFAVIVSKVAADGKIDWADAIYLVQYYNDNKKQ